MDSVFKNPEAVRRQMNLPAIVKYRFVGIASPRFHAQLEEIVTRVVGEANIRNRSNRPSAKGRYVSYIYDVYHDSFEDIETIYREVGSLEDARFVI